MFSTCTITQLSFTDPDHPAVSVNLIRVGLNDCFICYRCVLASEVTFIVDRQLVLQGRYALIASGEVERFVKIGQRRGNELCDIGRDQRERDGHDDQSIEKGLRWIVLYSSEPEI